MPRQTQHPKLNFIAIGAGALLYAALHLLFTALPHTLPAGDGYLDLRPGIVIPLAAGLLAGPWAGALVGGLGRLVGDLLAGSGVDGAGLVYSALLGLIAGLGIRPRADFRKVGALGWALLWVLIATVSAGLGVTLVIETALLSRLTWAGAWPTAVSEAASGAVAGVLLMPGVLLVASLRK
jgi:uncharacterized membrane protein